MINHKDRDKKQRRVKRIPITQEFMNYFFEHPDNIFAKKGLPNDATLVNIYNDYACDMWYIEYRSEEWDVVKEGDEVPEYNLEILEINCRRCENEMLYNEKEYEMYCPVCERKFRTKTR